MREVRTEIRRVHKTLRAAVGVVDVAVWLALPLIAAVFEELKLRALPRRERAPERFDASHMETGRAEV